MAREFQPMLAAPLPEGGVELLKFPYYQSPKLDGIRAVVKGGVLLSRRLKPIPSRYMQQKWGRPEFEGLDGELITGAPNMPDVFLRSTSTVMSRDAEPVELEATRFHVFDMISGLPYTRRLASLKMAFASLQLEDNFMMVPQTLVHNAEEMTREEEFHLQWGFEGSMLRHPDSPYKFGRSTLNEGYLLKVKRFVHDEYEVIGFDEKMHNANPLEKDERGYAKRSSHQENLVGLGTLGAWVGKVLTGPFTGKVVRVTPTGTHEMQAVIWRNQNIFMGQVRRMKYFPKGSKDLPRFPTDEGPRKD